MEFETPLGILTSPMAKEILNHMSHDEFRQLRVEIDAASVFRHRSIKRIGLVLIPVILTSVLFKSWAGFFVMGLTIVAFWFWQDRFFRRVQGSIANLLCATQYALSRGIQPHDLK
jgi:hypothetical protein